MELIVSNRHSNGVLLSGSEDASTVDPKIAELLVRVLAASKMCLATWPECPREQKLNAPPSWLVSGRGANSEEWPSPPSFIWCVLPRDSLSRISDVCRRLVLDDV